MFFAEEFKELDFKDQRLNDRFIQICENFINTPSSIIRHSMPEPSEAKAAYRFFNNPKVRKEDTLDAHVAQTTQRAKTANERVIVIQDTTYCNYNSRPATKGIGAVSKNQYGDIRGFCIHHSFCLTDKGMPLGLLTQQIYNHGDIEGKESMRWINHLEKTHELLPNAITICDREADTFEYLVAAFRLNASVVVRITENRYLRTALKTKENLKAHIAQQDVIGTYFFEHPKTKKPIPMTIRRALKVQLATPGRKKDKEKVFYNVIQVENVEHALEWTLMTNLECSSIEQMCDIVALYAKRWHIENFHKALKSCFDIEKAQLESFDRLKILITVLSICAYRLYALTHLARTDPDVPCIIMVNDTTWKVLYMLRKKTVPKASPSIYDFVRELAILGGYQARKSDPPPGFIVLHRGWERLQNALMLYDVISQEKDVGTS